MYNLKSSFLTRTLNVIRIVFICIILASCANSTTSSNDVSALLTQSPDSTAILPTPTTDIRPTGIPIAKDSNIINISDLSVHFIDVGQADCILVKSNGTFMLIDAGNNNDSDSVVSYIQSLGITKLDYVIGTHPHEDHIGGMDDVIKSFEIGTIIMPKASNNTRTFEDVLSAISSKGLKVTTPIPSTLYTLGDASFTILAPNSSSYKDLNNYSVVVKLVYGKTSFLLDGDAEDVSETEMLNKGYDLKANVLKVGHHGSTSSTTQSFLNAVKPTYAVISVGTGNTYGHPAPSTISKLNNAEVQVFRTDESGTIIATSDGSTIKFDKKASPVKEQAPPVVGEKTTGSEVADSYPDSKPTTDQYIGNKNSKKFHKPTCGSLPADYNRVYFNTRDGAINSGYVPCKLCKP